MKRRTLGSDLPEFKDMSQGFYFGIVSVAISSLWGE